MKNRIKRFIGVSILLLGSAVCGQTSNAVPYQETFEGIDVGSSIILTNNTNGWYSGTNTVSALITNVSYVWTNVLHPLESAAHTKVLKFADASLTNRFSAQEFNTTVDFMAQPMRSATAPNNSLVAGSQTALYLDTNGLMNVWYGLDSTGTNNAWLRYANIPVGTADWARVTIAFDYTTDAAKSCFKVTLDGIELQPPTNGYVKGVGTFNADPNGVWLLIANQTTKKIQSFAAVGSGMLDDLVVTTNDVTDFFPVSDYLLTGSVSGGNGTVTPSSTNVASGGTATFVVTANSYYRIASLTTNGAAAGSFNNGSVSTAFIWSNVQSSGAVVAAFMPQVASDPAATPYWWLAQYGLTNFDTDAVADTDLDGHKTWQEYLAGTNPTNAASVLKVLRVTTVDSNDTVKWLSSAGVVYNLVFKTNLMNNIWTTYSNNIAPTVPTNTITLTRPGRTVFYKITVTN